MERKLIKSGRNWLGWCEECQQDGRIMLNKREPICNNCWSRMRYAKEKELGYKRERVYVDIEDISCLLNDINKAHYYIEPILAFRILNMWLNITTKKITVYDGFEIDEQLMMMIVDINKYYKKSIKSKKCI